MYYEEIMKELNDVSEEGVGQAKRSIEVLFSMCKQYVQLYQMNQNLLGAKKVLQNYLCEDECLTRKKRKTKREKVECIDITTKLYIEFFWEVFKEHYQKKYGKKTERYFFDEVIGADEYEREINKIWKEIYVNPSIDEDAMKEEVLSSIEAWNMAKQSLGIGYMKKLSLSKLHEAMKIAEKELKKPEIKIEEAVEQVLTSQFLELLLKYLKAKEYPHCIFTVAPITRALTDGEINSYTPAKDNTTVFFNEKYEYNLKTLQAYIETLQMLYEEYTDVKNTIQEFKEKHS